MFPRHLAENLPLTFGEADKLMSMARHTNITYVQDKVQMKDNETSEELHGRENSVDLHARIQDCYMPSFFEFQIDLLPHLRKYKESGGDLNVVNAEGKTALAQVCGFDYARPKCVQWLLQHGANPNIPMYDDDNKHSSALKIVADKYQSSTFLDDMDGEATKKIQVVMLLVEHDATDMNILVGDM